jgi:CYTH domain-containing protein
VDCFQGENAPLVLAEVELASAQVDLVIPPWCGQEITGESRWSNAVLSQQPIQAWSLEDRRRFGWA